jgi:spoIIIJ-associated protein
VTLAIDVASSPITVLIEDEDNSGLIIGRDGQTITALQYLANRIVSKSWPQSPRIQLDAGDYRQKQEEQLLGIAQFLSEKAKKSGRVQSTRPLSSFHRRVVHMALQDDRGVQTRSKGEGHMKRVLILPVKRGKPGGRPPRRQEAAQARQS